jgi:hypothetical protein
MADDVVDYSGTSDSDSEGDKVLFTVQSQAPGQLQRDRAVCAWACVLHWHCMACRMRMRTIDSLMVKPTVFHSSISNAPSLPKGVIVHTGNIAIVPQSAGPTNGPKPSSLFAPRAVQLIGAQVRCKRRSCTNRKPCPECALSDHLDDVIAKVPTRTLVIYTDGGRDINRKSRVTRTLRSCRTGAQAHD